MRRAGERSCSAAVTKPTRQFNHCGFTEKDSSGTVEALDYGRVVVKTLMGIRYRAPRSGIALDRDKILDRVRHSVKRAAVVPCLDFSLSLARLAKRKIGSERHKGVQPLSDCSRAFKVALGEFDRRQLAFANGISQCLDRHEIGFRRNH